MVFLLVWGALLERAAGWRKMLAIYLAGGAAAGLLLAPLSMLLAKDLDGNYIGASGSISALMGACLVWIAFWRNGRQTEADAFPLPPAMIKLVPMAVLLYFLAKDFYHAFDSLDLPWLAAYWDHAGGWVFGLMVAFCFQEAVAGSRYRIQLGAYKLAYQGLEPLLGNHDLRAILKHRPLDARALLELARQETRRGDRIQGERLYRQAISTLWMRRRKDLAAGVFIEFFRAYDRIFAGAFQVELIQALIRAREYELAARALEQMVRVQRLAPDRFERPVLEHIFALLAQLLTEKLQRPASAKYYRDQSALIFPETGTKLGSVPAC
jgi:hypothetical protein